MIDFITVNTIDNLSDNYLNDNFFNYIILDYLYNNKNADINNIEDHLSNLFNINIIHTKFKNYYDLYYPLFTSEKYFDFVKLTNKFRLTLNNITFKINYNFFKENFSYRISILFDLIYKNKKTDYLYLYFDLILNYNNYYNKIQNLMNSIRCNNKSVKLEFFSKNEYFLQLLNLNEIHQFDDLYKLNCDELISLFSFNIKNFILKLEDLVNYDKNNLCNIIKNSIDNCLSNKEKEILCLRNGLNNSPILTLEEVGKRFDVTRERIRQIEEKADNKLKKYIEKYVNYFYISFNDILADSPFFTLEMINQYFNCNLNLLYGKYINFLDTNYKYEEKCQVYYDQTIISFEEICDNTISEIGNVVMIEKFNKLNNFQKWIVENFYNKKQNLLYLKKSVNLSMLIDELIIKLFPSGFRPSDSSQYNLLSKEYFDNYQLELPKDHALSGIMTRIGYILIDRGTYKNKTLCLSLPDDLIKKIKNYILKNLPLIHYDSIFKNFSNELYELGINNKYYLKGLIDPYLDDLYITKRDYISIDSDLTSKDIIINYFRKKDSFNYNDLKNRFKGLTDIVFNIALEQEFFNGLIPLSNKNYSYIKFQNENDKNECANILKNKISDYFEINECDFISTKTLYMDLLFNKSVILDYIPIINDSFSLFSVCKYLCKDDFLFNRPYISKIGSTNISTYSLYYNFINEMGKFNRKDLLDYAEKHNIGQIQNYIDFMDQISDKFVQISSNAMVKKELFNISENNLLIIKNNIDTELETIEKIDSRYLLYFSKYPFIGYRWNSYLLIGIIKTYFPEEYNITLVGNKHRDCYYIIEKKSTN